LVVFAGVARPRGASSRGQREFSITNRNADSRLSARADRIRFAQKHENRHCRQVDAFRKRRLLAAAQEKRGSAFVFFWVEAGQRR
jgi:hypothetical protein